MQAPRNVRFCNKVACNFFTPYVSERDEMKNAASTISTPGAKADTFNSLDDADVLPPFTSTIITNNANARVNSNTMIDSTATATTPTTHVTKSGVAIKLAGTSSVFETTVDYRNGANCAHVCACSTAEECSCSYDSSHGHNHRGVRFEDGNGNDDVGSQNGQTHAQHGSASTNSVHASAIEVPSAPINSLHENKNQPLAVQPCAVRSLTPDEARRLNRAMREREAKRARERELDAMEKKASEKAAEVAKAFKEQKRKNRWDQVLPEPQMDTEKGDSFDDERPDPCSTGPIGTSEQMTAFVAAFARMHVSNVIKNNKGRVDDSKLVELERSTEGMIEQHISKIIADYATQPKRSDMTASFVTDHHHPRETTPETSAASTNTTQDYTTLLPAANSITAEGRTAIAYLEHDTLVSNRDDVAVKNASDNTTPQETIVTTIASVPTTTVTEATPSIETTTSTPTETAIDHPPIQPNDSNDRNAFLALKGREFANSIAHKTRIPDRYSYNDVKPEQLISVKCLVFFDCEYRNIIGIASHDTAKYVMCSRYHQDPITFFPSCIASLFFFCCCIVPLYRRHRRCHCSCCYCFLRHFYFLFFILYISTIFVGSFFFNCTKRILYTTQRPIQRVLL